jgi:hypothetical protein
MLKNRVRPLLPLVFLFVLLNAFFITGKGLLQKWNADQDVLIIGNLFIFLITLIAFFISQSGLRGENPHAFVRSVYGSIMLRLFACMIAAFIYIAIYRKDLNKPAFFTLMALYLLYTFIEVSLLTKMLKLRKNG